MTGSNDPEPVSGEAPASSSLSGDEPLRAELKAVNEAVMDEESVWGSASVEGENYFRG